MHMCYRDMLVLLFSGYQRFLVFDLLSVNCLYISGSVLCTCTKLNFSSNILVLDEITDALDSIGVEKVFNLIGSALQDVEATYIISHHVDELEIPADDEIIIIKGDDKISRII